MRPKIIFFMAMLCAVTTSCKQQAVKEPDLSNIEAIYCMPTDPGKCLPLEIVRTADGWQARYSGAPSNQTLQLKPRYEVDEYEDSTIVLDEYLQDKPNGKYVFEKYAGEVLYTYQRVSYISGSGKDTIDFMGTIVWKDFIFIDQRNFKESVKKIASHHIDNNRLKPAKILEGKSCIEIVNYRTPDKKEVHFRYDITIRPRSCKCPLYAIRHKDSQASIGRSA